MQDIDFSKPLWVFGYGSLIWNPGFPVAEKCVASLSDYHRAFCMSSIHHRGTEDNPGLVLALDHWLGAQCDGVAFCAEPGSERETVDGLRERELISSAYVEEIVEVRLSDGRLVRALTYVIDRHHVQYCGGMPLEEQAQIIANAVGGRGPNTEYLYNTAEHLADLGLADADLDWLAERVRALTASQTA